MPINRASDDAKKRQQSYYASTARTYDATHIHDDDEHQRALSYIATLLPGLKARSVLDTGCGTGRGIRFMRERFPDLVIKGNDPSADLLRTAVDEYGVPADSVIESDTLSLTNQPGSFDVVMSFGVLHHVRDSAPMVEKMVELASKAVFISDSNYLGQGPWPVRLIKWALTEANLYRTLKFVQQGFKPYGYSEGDGVFYSYSVFRDLPILEKHCRFVWAVPTGLGLGGAQWPKLCCPQALLCGVK